MEKSILITGCSSGIGLAAAQSLQKRGYRVFASARKAADVEGLKAQGLVDAVQLDICDSHSIKAALQEVLAKTGGTLDALFNNCGYVQSGAIEDLSRERMQAQFETNVFGPMELTCQVLPIMRKQGYGRIVQNSSMCAVVALPYIGAYTASKFALDGFSSTLRQELYGTNIKVVILAPGPIKSKLREKAKDYFIKGIAREQSAYQAAYDRLEAYYGPGNTRNNSLSLEPEAVIKDLIAALEKKNPKPHYFVGNVAKAFELFRRFLPERMLDWIIHKVR